MDEKEQEEALRNKRLLWIMGLAFFWELVARPLLGIICPQMELPPSLIRELLQLANMASGLPL